MMKIWSNDASIVSQLKRAQLGNIDDSYRNEWDILAELGQNCVDAIRVRQKSEPDGWSPQIDVLIDADSRTISFKDNGVGFELNKKPQTLLGEPTLLDLNVSSKRDSKYQIGEKGVGLKFAVFNCDLAEIKTCDGCNSATVVIRDGLAWKKDSSQHDPPEAEVMGPVAGGEQGTQITLQEFGSQMDVIWALSFEQLIFVLRTKTALGSTSSLWSSNDKSLWGESWGEGITVDFTHVQEGVTQNQSFKSEFWSPHEVAKKVEDYDQFLEWTRKKDRSDKQKRARLRGKLIVKRGVVSASDDQRKIRYFMVFMPSRDSFDQLSVEQRLCTSENLDDDKWMGSFGFARFQSGLQISSKGMPTGVVIDPPNTGFFGYWSNILMLVEDDKLIFDIGRKSLDGRATRTVKEVARKEFNSLLKVVSKYVSGGRVGFTGEFDVVRVAEEVKQLPDLQSEFVSFQKAPAGQEATVVGIFFEMLGRGYFDGIRPLSSGFKNTYDLYADVRVGEGDWRFKVLEFKASLTGLIKDLVDRVKFTSEINCVVCWGVDSSVVSRFEDEGYTVSEVDGEDDFPHATHMVEVPGSKDFWVIDLERVLLRLRDLGQ